MTKSKNPQTMEELLLDTNRTLRTFRYGEIVEGTVISVDRKEVFVDLGSKSEGIIGGRGIEGEVDPIADLKVGDKVIASVIQTENDQGYIILSLKRAQSERAWRTVEEAFKNGTALEVKVIDSNKGGLVVELPPPHLRSRQSTGSDSSPSRKTSSQVSRTSNVAGGLRGFVPFSHLQTTAPVDDVSTLLGRTLTVRVIELNRSINRLVFSEKLASLLSDPKIKNFYESLKPEKRMKGTVTSIFPFGVFVKLTEGVEGLVHISEICWERIDRPEEVVEVGDRVEVVVLSVNKERGQLALSMRALLENPWEKIAKKYKVGDTVSGTVVKTVPFGAFVKLPEGIEGLIHVSETTGPLAEGEKVEAVIINLEPEKQKLGLSVKKLQVKNSKFKVTMQS